MLLAGVDDLPHPRLHVAGLVVVLTGIKQVREEPHQVPRLRITLQTLPLRQPLFTLCGGEATQPDRKSVV